MHSIWLIAGALALFALWMLEVDGRWLAAGAVAWLGLAFNSVIHARNAAETALASVGVMLKKRFDLIPNLVDTVQRYVEHEADLLAELVRLRAQAVQLPPEQAAAVDGQIGPAVSRILATAESHPELEASETFQQLQRSLNEVEEQISAARRSYNMAVKGYNDVVRMFPTNLLALVLGYRERPYFEVPAGHDARPEVMARFRAHQRS